MSELDVTTETVINRPIDVVSAYAGDPANVCNWYKNIASVEVLTPPPLHVGSRASFVAKFMGKTIAYTYEFTTVEPGKRIAMRTEQGPFPMATTYEWEAVDANRTRMRLRNVGHPSGFSRLAAPFMARAVGRANTNDLKALKSLLESTQ